MTWARLDDGFPMHPKIASVGPLGMALQVAAICYANRYLTDGHIPQAVARGLLTWTADDRDGAHWTLVARGPAGEDREVDTDWVIGLLLSAGVWREAPGGYQIHDFTEYQMTREQVQRRRAKEGRAKSEAGRRRVQQAARDGSGRFVPAGQSAGIKAAASSQVTPSISSSPPAGDPADVQQRGDQQAVQQTSSPIPIPIPIKSQDLDLQGAGPDEDPAAEDQDQPVSAGEALGEDLGKVLNPDQRYLLGKIARSAPAFADLLPQHLLKIRKTHGDPVLTTALQRIVELNGLSRVRKPGSYLDVAVADVAAGEAVSVGKGDG